jgi:ubiquitin-like-conjugating enzyme ATG3
MDVVRLFRNTREWITPVLHESAFTERGVLTPEEFVRAGDQLVLKCPTWSWQSGEKNNIRPYLPAEKQFLIIRGCPSHQRVTTMNSATVQDYSVGSNLSGVNDKDGDWCAPQIIECAYDDEVLIDAEDFLGDENDSNGSAISHSLAGIKINDPVANLPNASNNIALEISKDLSHVDKVASVDHEKQKADEYEDMEDESLALDESATSSSLKGSDRLNSSVDPSLLSQSARKESALVRSRRYDVSITYDKYYQVTIISVISDVIQICYY